MLDKTRLCAWNKHQYHSWDKNKQTLMTKTFDVYMLFTQFVNLNNVYEVLFFICNTDTNLYDFYIKRKSNFFFGWIYSLLSFMNKHIYSKEVKFDYFQSAIAMPDLFMKTDMHERTVSSRMLRFSLMNVIK